MNIQELIDSLWEKSSHGTDRETVVMIFNAALEEAAKVCDDEALAHRLAFLNREAKQADTAKNCAAAIRALKGVKE